MPEGRDNFIVELCHSVEATLMAVGKRVLRYSKRTAGAVGGKLLGAGGGGFMLFFVRPERRKALKVKQNLLCVPHRVLDQVQSGCCHEAEEAYEKALSEERSFVYA